MITRKGRHIPVQAARGSDHVTRPLRVDDGNLALTGEYRSGSRGRLPEVEVVTSGEGAYLPHFARCPTRQRHHKPRESIT
jgi:hypothetical protein